MFIGALSEMDASATVTTVARRLVIPKARQIWAQWNEEHQGSGVRLPKKVCEHKRIPLLSQKNRFN